MAGLFRWRKAQEQESDIPYAPKLEDLEGEGEQGSRPAAKIRFHPRLIEKLVADHREFEAVAGQILKAYDQEEYGQTAKLLSHLRKRIGAHFMLESVHLYIYLRHMELPPPEREIIKRCRSEMDTIGMVAINLLGELGMIESRPEIRTTFPEQFTHLAKVLTDRIELEERELYPLYQAP